MICGQLNECIEDRNEMCRRERQCIQYTDTRSTVKCEEKRKKYHLNNDCGGKIRKYQMDGQIVRNEQGFDACDHLLAVYGERETRLVFVELKGKDFKHAVEQTYHTVKYFSTFLEKKKLYARIVHVEGVPRIGNSGPMVDLERLLRKNGGNLKKHEWCLPEKVSDLDRKEL